MGAVVLVSDLLEPLRNVFDYEGMLLLVYHDDGPACSPRACYRIRPLPICPG